MEDKVRDETEAGFISTSGTSYNVTSPRSAVAYRSARVQNAALLHPHSLQMRCAASMQCRGCGPSVAQRKSVSFPIGNKLQVGRQQDRRSDCGSATTQTMHLKVDVVCDRTCHICGTESRLSEIQQDFGQPFAFLWHRQTGAIFGFAVLATRAHHPG